MAAEDDESGCYGDTKYLAQALSSLIDRGFHVSYFRSAPESMQRDYTEALGTVATAQHVMFLEDLQDEITIILGREESSPPPEKDDMGCRLQDEEHSEASKKRKKIPTSKSV